MTIQRIGGSKTLLPDPHLSSSNVFGASTIALDATGEALHYSGQIYLAAESGSKTISSAGGKIYFRSSTTTFASASSTFRAGLQDTSSVDGPPGRGDGTFDVYGELVGGTDTIATSSMIAVAMESGTKTLAHGDMVTIVLEMTARGGSDSVTASWIGNAENIPQRPVLASYLSASWARVQGTLNCCVEFDDGTLGWIFGSAIYSMPAMTQNFNSGSSTADEYGNLINVPMPVVLDGLYAYVYPASRTADFELCLYEDAFGTPVLVDSVTIDATQVATTGGAVICYGLFSHAYTLKQNTNYAVTVRPTTTGNVTINYFDVDQAAMLDMYQLGQGCYAVRRIDNSGAFSDWNGGTAKTRRIVAGVIAAGFHDAWGESRAQSLIGV